MTETRLPITDIGQFARKILSEATTAAIFGTTSRGIFLRIDNRKVIFLSHESKRGPLTLNLPHAIPTPFAIQQNQPVELQNGDILFPESQIRFQTGSAADWLISAHPHPVLPPQDVASRIRVVSQAIIAQRGGVGLIPLFANLLHIPLPEQPNQPAFAQPIDSQQLHQKLHSPDERQVISQLQKMVGAGSGLTPSGDDLISGFLLTCNRYQDVLAVPFEPTQVNRAMIEVAYQKTSLLSANLIECATFGQADERLILALDGILAGTMDPASCANHLLSWGNSSGCDAFTGMVLALYQPNSESANLE